MVWWMWLLIGNTLGFIVGFLTWPILAAARGPEPMRHADDLQTTSGVN